MKNRLLAGLLMLGVASGILPCLAVAQTPGVAVVFSICTGLPSAAVVDFTTELNRYTTVSDVSPVLSCGVMTPLSSSDQILSMRLEYVEGALFLSIEPAAKSASGEPTGVTHRREIDWIHTEAEFIKKTQEAGKVKTLALLIDNMVLDYADIRLSPDAPPVTDAFAVSGDTSDTMSPTPMVRIFDDGAASKKVRVTEDAAASRSVSCDSECKECEKKLYHLRLTLGDTNAQNNAPNPAAASAPDDRWVVVGAGGGVNLFTAGNLAPQMMIDVSLVRSGAGLVMRFAVEGDSSFEISDEVNVRRFDTRAGVLELGPGWFWNTRRFGFSLQPLLVLRYWEVKRADLADATTKLFVDMGPGLHAVIAVALGKYWGIFFRSGVQIFPRARRIVIENGPRKRIGFFHFPLNLGLFIRF